MRDVEEKKGKLINLKDELESLNRRELNIFLFDFIKEPCAYVSGRFSDAISFEEIKKCAFCGAELLVSRDYYLGNGIIESRLEFLAKEEVKR